MRVAIDQDQCVFSGQCLTLAPGVFDQDEDGMVVLLTEETTSEEAEVREAIRICPAQAISSPDA